MDDLAGQLGEGGGAETRQTCLELSLRRLPGRLHGQTAVVAFYQRYRVLCWKMGEGLTDFFLYI
jgi:hypothetical protein